MSPRSDKQYEDIRNAKRKIIMSDALQLFAENGYFATSINDIADKAKISKGLIYNYFSGKEDLLKAIVVNGLQDITEIFDPNKDGFLSDDEFDFFIDRIFEVLKKNIPFWRLYYSLLMKSDVIKIIKEPMLEFIAPFLNTLTDYYKRHGRKNPDTCAMFFGSTLDGISINFISAPELFPLNDMKILLKEKLK
jgi:AcrR family transcriptional regulator